MATNGTAQTLPHHGNHVHKTISELVNKLVSPIAPYSGMILTIAVVCLAVVRIYGLDLLLPRIYPKRVFADLNPIQKRSFTNHHIAAGTKILVVILAAYPFLAVATGARKPTHPMVHGGVITLGDMLIVSSQIFVAMYVFELFYRDKISPISCAHHIGAILIAQVAVSLTIQPGHEVDAVPEFILAFVWGAFDCLAELWPHICMILYRVYPDRHHYLSKLLFAATYLELFSTVLETGIVMWLFGSLWDIWSDSLKIATPILHILFSVAQLWGAWILWGLAKHHRKLAKDEDLKRKIDGDAPAIIMRDDSDSESDAKSKHDDSDTDSRTENAAIV